MNNLFIRFSLQDQILFAKRLATLIRAGVPVVAAMKIIRKQAQTSFSKRVYDTMITDVENGQFLHTSMQKFRKIFGDFSVNIVRIGETSGTLQENLNYLADELKKKQALRRKVIGALVYPVIIVIATLGITALLTLYVFPKILPIFKSLNFELPWTTRVLIFSSDFFGNYWYFIFGALAVLFVAFLLLMRMERFRYFVHHIVLSIPLLGRLAKNYQMANFCRTLGLLLRCDVMIVEATRITANATTNLVYREALHIISNNVTRGEKMSQYMDKKTRLFPPILSQMVTVGETSGNLSDTLEFLAEMYENEVDELTKNLSTVLEPVLLVFMGMIVGFIAVSIITPIYEITQNIHP
ncbi:MAG: type II secretion system F family protein [bacterium]|nr:type II secretion system F family protein [bacterium]